MILKAKFSNNKYYPVLVDENKIPKYFPLKFLILNQKGKSYRTKYNAIKSYSLFELFIEEFQRSKLSELIFKGDFETILTRLPYYGNWLTKHTKSSANINIYLLSIKNVFLWASSIYSNNSYEDSERIKIIIENQTLKINSKKSYINSLSKFQITSIFNQVEIENEGNPFLPKNRIRNLLIILFLYETGIRKGELLKIKINDVICDENRFYISINDIDGIEDPRRIVPSLKTYESQRVVGISSSTYELFEDYIKYFRKKKMPQDYLFISEQGTPLSLSMLGKIFDVISKKVEFRCSPHMFRHSFAERILKYLIENKNLDMERAKDELRNICGWTLNSSMPNHYAQKYIQEIANQHNMERLQNGF